MMSVSLNGNALFGLSIESMIAYYDVIGPGQRIRISFAAAAIYAKRGRQVTVYQKPDVDLGAPI